MYVTRPLSLYRKFPSNLSVPPDAPYSGILVITDEHSQAQDTLCWGSCKRKKLTKLPFPQDKILKIVHPSDYNELTVTKVWLLPVLDQPPSSNRYYAIRIKGKYKGLACTCSRENATGLCCFGNFIKDRRPKPFDYTDMYQVFKIHHHHRGRFFAESIAPDGFPPKFLREKGWKVRCSSIYPSLLRQALGLDVTQRALHPDLNFPITTKCSNPIIVGNWYCPFVFVREGKRRKIRSKKCMLYKMTLEQWWEEIYSCENDGEGDNFVTLNVVVERKKTLVYGMEAIKRVRSGCGGFAWFLVENGNGRRGDVSVGLSSAIMEKMRMVQEEGGWVDGGERVVKVNKVERNGSENGGWHKFCCYVLVESFVLRRMDGGLVFNCDYRHTHLVHCKWE